MTPTQHLMNAITSVTTSPHTLSAAGSSGAWSGKGISDWVLGILGSLVGALIAARGFGHWAKKEYGELITNVGVGVMIGAFCWFPADVINFLKFLWNAFKNGHL